VVKKVKTEKEAPASTGKKTPKASTPKEKAKVPKTPKTPKTPKQAKPVMSVEKFLKEAKPVDVQIAYPAATPVNLTLEPKKFTTGTYGWGVAGKTVKVKRKHPKHFYLLFFFFFCRLTENEM
jgi:hypothetical protein